MSESGESQEVKIGRIDERTLTILEEMRAHKITHREIDETLEDHGKAISAQNAALKVVAWFAGIPLVALATAGAAWLFAAISRKGTP